MVEEEGEEEETVLPRDDPEFNKALKLREYNDSETRKRVKFYMDSGNKIINKGIQEGLEKIIYDLPRLAKKGDILLKDLNKPAIKEYFQETYNNLLQSTRGKLTERDVDGIVKNLADYIADTRTDAFKEKGKAKNLILKEGLKAKAEEGKVSFLDHIFNRGKAILRGESYIDRAIESFDHLYELMKTGDYSRRMPELSKTVNEVYDLGFFDAAANILFEGELLNPRKYASLKKTIRKSAEQKVKYAKETLESYVLPRRAAAAFLGAIGLGSLLMNNSITGNVVGVGNPNIFGLLGGILLLIFAGLLWFAKKKQVEYKTRRKNKRKKKKR